MSATRYAWSNLQSLPPQRSVLGVERDFTAQEYEQISFGLIPECMEDKWFIFLEENTLYIHRSWSGYCIYEVHLAQEEQGYRIREVWVNRNPSQYTHTDDRFDQALLLFLLDRLLLEKPAAVPQANLPPGIEAELQIQHLIGTGRSATEITQPPPPFTVLQGLRVIGRWILWLLT